jgi:hypothetical protein
LSKRRFPAAIAALLLILSLCFAIEKEKTAPNNVPRSELRIALLTGFSYTGDSAAASIERSFVYSLQRTAPQVIVEIVRAESPYEVAAACDTLLRQDALRLIVFAGDEGAAVVTALGAATQHIPVLKLTSDPRSCSRLCPVFFDFLPSGEMQARYLAEFASRDLSVPACMLLTAQDARGRALADGFKQGLKSSKAILEGQRFYPVDTYSVRAGLAALFADSTRLARGGTGLKTALSSEERAQAFGDASRGEVLFTPGADSTKVDTIHYREGLFFAVTPERALEYSKQLPVMPTATMLMGNSSWIDLQEGARLAPALNGMYISAPLLPEESVSDTGLIVLDYRMAVGKRTLSAWELLGLDAGEFVGRVLDQSPRKAQEVAKLLSEAPRYVGRATVVDFAGGHENRAARVLRFDNGDLRVIR